MKKDERENGDIKQEHIDSTQRGERKAASNIRISAQV